MDPSEKKIFNLITFARTTLWNQLQRYIGFRPIPTLGIPTLEI